MRRIVIAVMSTISGLVLLFSYHTSTGQSSTAGTLGAGGGTGSGTANGSTGTGSGSGSSGSGSGSSGSGSGSSSSTSSTVTGDAAQTRWGPVQVRITVQGGKITAADAVVYPTENHRDVEINSYAVPVLNQQAVSAQSAQLDGVSGATVTSVGYQQSLQSAIDKAKLG